MEMIKRRLKPSFLIIGTQKGGTSSLFKYLSQHRDLISPANKEIHYFSSDTNYVLGDSWYHKQFPKSSMFSRTKITYEATPAYLFCDSCPERIFKYNKNMKLIVMLRDPIDRAYSAWNMFKNFKTDPVHYKLAELRSFEKAICDEMLKINSEETILSENCLDDYNYIKRWIYVQQLKRYFDVFQKNQILIIEKSDIENNLEWTLNSISEYIGISHFDFSNFTQTRSNVGRYSQDTIPLSVSMELSQFYNKYNNELFDLLQTKYDWK